MNKTHYSVHNSESSANEEIQRLNEIFGLPDSTKGATYAQAESFDGGWKFKVKTEGVYKADHIASNVQEFELETPEEPA